MLLAASVCGISASLCAMPSSQARQSIVTYEVAQAPQCRECSRLPTIAECVECALRSGYDRAESSRWCQRNQPRCSKR